MNRLPLALLPALSSRHRALRRGFTLVELMITVLILAALTTAAVASYKKYIHRVRSQEAVNFLMALRIQQETYFSLYNQYVSSGTDAEDWFPKGDPSGATPMPWNLQCPGSSDIEKAWCSLGVKAAFDPCPSDIASTSGQCANHRFVTRGWRLGGDTPPDDLITNPKRRWWYALGEGDVDGDGKMSRWFISSEVPQPYNKNGDDL